MTNYNVHRSTTPNFTPTTANRIAQPTSTSYTDTGLAAGTYFYRVTAQDAAGNVSPSSNEASAAPTADTTPPTAPANLTATGSAGSVSLSWGASTDDVGVSNYNVHRSTTPNFTPTTANRIAQPTSTSYTDSGLAAGTYYYRVTAQDAAGNVSPSSNEASGTASPAPTGLVAAYGFNEGAGTTTADGSGNNNTGTVANTSWAAAGKYGQALSFNGVNSWVTVNDSASLGLTTGMTFEAWVDPMLIAGWRTVLLKEASPAAVYSLYANDDLPRPESTVRIGGTYYTAQGTSALALNTWSHLASTYDGTTLRLYVNGTQVGSIPASGSIKVSGGVLRIGGNAIGGEYFAGLIDEVRIYNRALSQTEIQTDMNTPIGSPERLQGEAVAAGDRDLLGQQEVRPLFEEAVTRWSAALGDAAAIERLRNVRVEVLDLPGTTLGLASGSVIFVDADAAGHGWFVDPTPAEDSEFAPGVANSPAAGRVDLLTVMTHEMGHILGLDDDHETDPVAGSVMADVLPLGVRRIHLEGLVPTAPAVPIAFVSPAAPEGQTGLELRPLPAFLSRTPFSPISRAGAETGSGVSGRLPPGPPLDAGVAMILTAVPVIGSSPAPAGPVLSGSGDRALAAGAPGTARPHAPLPAVDIAPESPPLLEPHAASSERKWLDLVFAELTGINPFDPDWWPAP